MEILVVLYTGCVVILLFLIWVMKTDWRELRGSRELLHKEWDRYYAESRKYRKMKQVKVTFNSGEVVLYDAEYISNTETSIELYGRNDKIVSIISKSEVRTVDIIREDAYTPGSRNLGDDN